MIKLFYSILNQFPTQEIFEEKLRSLPNAMKEKILLYHNFEDKVIRLCGKLLLKKAYNESADIYYTNFDIVINEYGKPKLQNNYFHYNTAYSGKLAVCIISSDTIIGIDIEKVVPIEWSLYKEYFTNQEWNLIISNTNRYDTDKMFYHLWTRKEALIKVTGKGLFTELNTIDVINDQVLLNNKTYYLQKIHLHPEFICHTATELYTENLLITAVNIF